MPAYLPIVAKYDDRAVKNATKSLKKFGQDVAKIAAAATAAVAGIAVVSVKEFAKFDAALQQSVSIMGDVSDAMRNDMADAAREVAKTTTFSAEQAAESFFFLASAGLDAEASIAAMPQVAKFAQAGMFDMALATDLLTDAQSALGLTVRDDAIANLKNMAGIADVLVKANTLANASVEQFSTALTTKAGPAMRALGMDVEEGVAVLAAFADQGIKAELAGTSFSIVLRDLQTKALNNSKEFADVGVAVFDASGEFRNMADIVSDLENATAGLSDEQKKATFATLGFSDKSFAAIAALLGTSDAIRTYEAELRNAQGTTDEIANKQLQTMTAQFELLKSRMADIGIEIGGNLAPIFLKLFDDMEPVLQQAGPSLVKLFEALTPAIQGLTALLPVVFDVLIAAIDAVTVAVRDYLYPAFLETFGWIKDNIPTVATFVGVLGTLSAIIAVVTNATKIMAVAQAALAVVMAANPFYLIAAAVAAVAAGIVYLATQTTFFQDVWAAVTQFFTDAYKQYIEPVIEAFKAGITALYENVLQPVFKAAMLLFGLLAGTWVLIYEEIIQPILNIFATALQHLFDFAKMIFDAVSAEFKKLGEFFGQVFEAIITPVIEAIQTAFEHIGNFIADVIENIIKPAFKAMGDGLQWVYDNLIEPVANTIQTTFETVADAIGTAFNAVKTTLTDIFNAMVEVIKPPLNAIIGFVNDMIDGLNSIRITIPTWVPEFGGQSFGINIPRIPQLAKGGIVMPQPGGVIANIAEAGKPEAVIPLNRMDTLGSTYNITINAGVGSDPVTIGRFVTDAIKRYESVSGKVFASA